MADASETKFQIGLAMSGAISAGAYTAGVFDFLIQALDEWEKAWNEESERSRLNGGSPTIPPPAIGIKVMSGASAGAITAAVGTVALADGNQAPQSYRALAEVSKANSSRYSSNFHIYLPKLYDTWVERPDLALYDELPDDRDEPERRDLLDTIDLTRERGRPDDFARTSNVPAPKPGAPIPVAALLNWRLLDDIAKAAVTRTTPRAPRPYISDKLHIYLTLSNLRGVPYRIEFQGRDFHMISHGDRVHYQVGGVGDWNTWSEFADSDKKRKIDAKSLWSNDNDEWKDFSICALASAAFPVGLAPRDIGTLTNEYDGTLDQDNCYRRFPIEGLHDGAGIRPNWPAAVHEDFWFRTADGGIIDNDPFEYAHLALKEKIGLPNPREPENADRAVIMISPFPEQRPIRPEGQPTLDITSIFSSLLPSLIDQARFKPSELVHAADKKYASRFLIGPSRTLDLPEKTDATASQDEKPQTKEVEQRYGIASGLLGGFGGFLARDFRDHDFQLGRRNCQKFLKDTFVLPEANDIIRAWPSEAKANEGLRTMDVDGKIRHPLIPLFGTAKDEVVLRAWPQVDEARLDVVAHRIAQRFDIIVPRLIDQNVRGFLGLLLKLATARWTSFIPGLIRRRVLEYAALAILADLVRRNQIEEWNDLPELPKGNGLQPDDIRAVLAELIEPGFDQRTLAGLVKAMTALRGRNSSTASAASLEGVKETEDVQGLLDACMSAQAGERYKVWKAPWTDKEGKALYALQSRADGISWFDRSAIPFGIWVSETLSRPPFQWAVRTLRLPNIGNWFPKPRTDPPGVA